MYVRACTHNAVTRSVHHPGHRWIPGVCRGVDRHKPTPASGPPLLPPIGPQVHVELGLHCAGGVLRQQSHPAISHPSRKTRSLRNQDDNAETPKHQPTGLHWAPSQPRGYPHGRGDGRIQRSPTQDKAETTTKPTTATKNKRTIRMRPPRLHWALSQSHGYPRERGDRRIQRSLKRWGRKTHDTDANKKAPRTLRWRASTWREAHLGKARIHEGGAQGPPPPLSSRGPEHIP